MKKELCNAKGDSEMELFISNIMYLLIIVLIFLAILSVGCIFEILFDEENPEFERKCWRDLK